ncbi:MAG: hypothetical protein J6I73_00315 [Treponema sp.]|nr:hypothetical protein [Treponema sp.]
MNAKKIIAVLYVIFFMAITNACNANDTISVLNGRVTFEIPSDKYIINDNDPVKMDIKDVTCIRVVCGTTVDEELIYQSEGVLSSVLEKQLKKDGKKIIKEHILKLYDEKHPLPYVIIADRPTMLPHYVDMSYEQLERRGVVIGESVFEVEPYKLYRHEERSTFYSVSLGYTLRFVIDNAIVGIGIHYYNMNDKEILESFPEIFEKQPDGLYAWRNADARNAFYELFNAVDYSILPPVLYRIRKTRDMILSTLRIADYDLEDKVTGFYIGNILKATDNLRLREDAFIQVQTLATIAKGTDVKILALGKDEVIDDILSNWLFVEVQPGGKDKDGKLIPAGTQGWCFGGYLK